MAQTKVSAELLRQFAQTLRTEKERFESIKKQMDEQLESFRWQDPVAVRFKAGYAEGVAPLEKKLLPAMDTYQQHLDKEADIIEKEWLSDTNTATFAAVGGVAAGIGLGTAAVNSNMPKDDFSSNNRPVAFGKTGVKNYEMNKINETINKTKRPIRQPLSQEKINALKHPIPNRELIDKYKTEFKREGITGNKPIPFQSLDNAFSKIHNLNENELTVRRDYLSQNSVLLGQSNGTKAIINNAFLETNPDRCEIVNVAAHEAAHVENHKSNTFKHSDYKQVSDDCKNEIGNYNTASNECKIQYEDYLKQPEERYVRIHGEAAEKACNELKAENNALLKTTNTQELSRKRPKRITK